MKIKEFEKAVIDLLVKAEYIKEGDPVNSVKIELKLNETPKVDVGFVTIPEKK